MTTNNAQEYVFDSYSNPPREDISENGSYSAYEVDDRQLDLDGLEKTDKQLNLFD